MSTPGVGSSSHHPPPLARSPCGAYEGSEYQYPVVLNQTNKVASFINIEDMLFEVIVEIFVSFTYLLGIYYLVFRGRCSKRGGWWGE